MKVSVVMPTHGRAEYLPRAIESVLGQTISDWELIVVDDNPPGSATREETGKVVSRYSDSRIRYVLNDRNLGGALTRNHGIDEAKTKYISFLDDDDKYLPERLAVQLKAMEENGWDFAVMDGATYRHGTEEKVSERHQRVQEGMTNEELMRIHLLYHLSGTNTFMFRADYLRKIGGFDDAPSCQEWFLMEKALMGGGKFGYLPGIHIRNYQHPGGQLSTGKKKLVGQKILFEHKKRHFRLLTAAERRQVVCRHHGVLFFVHFKMHHYLRAACEAVRCFFASPRDAVAWMKEYKGKITA
ncbi:MAG: glycosyltransferase family 2 protein [Kiritimatiellae bacterium]|nr:glycosyltransferase family 2 protein [Kiritimatiellia bacterium]